QVEAPRLPWRRLLDTRRRRRNPRLSPARTHRTDVCNAVAWPGPPVPRARLPRLPAAAGRPGARARGVRVLSGRRVVRGPGRDRVHRGPVLRAGRADPSVAGVRAGRRGLRGPFRAAAGDRRGQPDDRGRRGRVRPAGPARAAAAVADDRARDAHRRGHGRVLSRLAPDRLLQEASALSRLAMNAAQMAGAAIAGVFVAAAGPGWALATCGIGMLGTVPLLLAIRAPGAARTQSPSVLRELRDGWSA